MNNKNSRKYLAFFCFYAAIAFGEATKCYHCYDSFGNTTNSRQTFQFGDKFIRCDKNILRWNSWDCPAKWPICIVMTGKVKDHYEIVRTCAEQDFCSRYIPPIGVKLDRCRECNTALCNDYPESPEPPVVPGPEFIFNININLNLKKYPYVDGGR